MKRDDPNYSDFIADIFALVDRREAEIDNLQAEIKQMKSWVRNEGRHEEIQLWKNRYEEAQKVIKLGCDCLERRIAEDCKREPDTQAGGNVK